LPARRGRGQADGHFARIELRGKLGKGPTTELTADKYAVRVEGKSQSFILIFPDEATRKAAKDLLGEFVVVTGELDFKEGDSGKRFASIIPFPFVTVKSLKKAEPLPKK